MNEDHAVTVIAPTQYPEKFPPLLYALALSERALLVATAIDRSFAECAATADLFDLPVHLLHGPTVGPDELRKVLRGLRFAERPIEPVDLPKLRQELGGWSTPAVAGPTLVRLDHAFPVRGVGTVGLGIVLRGTLTPHASLRLLPLGKAVEIRSIQLHDVEVPEAVTGDRVGVAVRGADPDEITRGSLLTADGGVQSGTSLHLTRVRRSPYYRGEMGVGRRLHALVGAQFVPVAVVGSEPEELRLESDRPIAWQAGETAIVVDLDSSTGPRGAARGTLS